MIDYIKGNLMHKGSEDLVIDCGGVGMRILSSISSIAEIGDIASEVICYTDLVVREDSMFLVGFSRREELDVYRMLTSVNGVGPKVALTILSSLPYRLLCSAIVNKDLKALQAAKGVGKKTAELIVVELKDKLSRYLAADESVGSEILGSGAAGTPMDHDASAALMALGYSRAEAMAALEGLDYRNMELDDVIKAALKRLMRL
ncbi:MAG: Holliday junction branch migration protein RuvA [Bacillota bacterium]|nr:Holliday junction branch migration protein RuvA [Bacillota bacterium]